MADASTTLYGLVKPEVGASADSWGGKLNNDLDDTDALLGAFVLTGSSSAYVLTTGLSLAAYATKQRFKVQWNHTNASTSPTLNVDAISAKNIKKRDGSTSPSASDLVSGRWNEVLYDGTNMVVTDLLPSDFQAGDATLTALAALSWSSGSPVLQFTAADTVSLTLTPSVTDLTVSGVLSIATKSSPNPSVYATGDTDTGICWETNNNLSIIVGGARHWRINSTAGFFGDFGTGSPQLKPTVGSVSAPNFTFSGDDNTGLYRIGADNIGFALGGVKYVDWATTLAQFVMPVQARIPLSSETTGTLTVASANKKINASGGITLPASVFTADDAIIIDGNGTARTITRGSGLTMYVNGTDSATATLTANGVMGVTYRSATVCILTGNVS